MAKHDKYKLYGELAKKLYGMGCSFAEIGRILSSAFPAGGDAAPPDSATVGNWYRSEKNVWDAERAVGKSVHAAMYDIFAKLLAKCHEDERFAQENADTCAKWHKNWRDAKAAESEDRLNVLKSLHRDVDKPAMFVNHLGFIFSVLPPDSAAYKSLAEQYESIIEKYKDHVAAQANHRA